MYMNINNLKPILQYHHLINIDLSGSRTHESAESALAPPDGCGVKIVTEMHRKCRPIQFAFLYQLVVTMRVEFICIEKMTDIKFCHCFR